MDLILLVLVLVVVGFLVWLLTTKVPLPPYWATAIQIVAVVILVLYMLRVFGVVLPNLLR